MNSETLKTQFKQQAQGALSLNIAFIGVTGGLFPSSMDWKGPQPRPWRRQPGSMRAMSSVGVTQRTLLVTWRPKATCFASAPPAKPCARRRQTA